MVRSYNGIYLSLVLAALVVIPVGSARAAVLAQSSFDDPAAAFDGWIASEEGGDNNAMTYEASGGDPGGYITADDINDGLTWYWRAPAKFLGDQSAAYGSTLTYSLRQHLGEGDSPSPFEDNDVVLVGGGLTLVHQYPTLSDGSYQYPAVGDPYPGTGGTWSHYSISLVESRWHVGDIDGPIATKEQLQATLADLTALSIRGEYQSGDDHGDLDNVILSGSATPVTPVTPTPSKCGAAGAENLPVLGLMCMLGLCLTRMFVHRPRP